MFPMTTWDRRLLIANIALFVVTTVAPNLYFLLMLYPPAALFRPWTLVTYMFLHAGLAHLLFNMIGLFFFGPLVEQVISDRR